MNNALKLHTHAVSAMCLSILLSGQVNCVFQNLGSTILSQTNSEGFCNSLTCFILNLVEVHANLQGHVGGKITN